MYALSCYIALRYNGTPLYIDASVQDGSNSSALAMELLQSSTKSSISSWGQSTRFSGEKKKTDDKKAVLLMQRRPENYCKFKESLQMEVQSWFTELLTFPWKLELMR